jgi:hypothetical protein
MAHTRAEKVKPTNEERSHVSKLTEEIEQMKVRRR